MDIDKAAKLGKKMQKGSFDFDDFLLQSQSVRKLGGMGGMLKMIPGMAGKISDEALFEAEKRIKRCEVIIGAMTAEERTNPDMITVQVIKPHFKRNMDIAHINNQFIKYNIFIYLFNFKILYCMVVY